MYTLFITIKKMMYQEVDWHISYTKTIFSTKRHFLLSLLHFEIYVTFLLPGRYITCNRYLDVWFPVVFALGAVFIPGIWPWWCSYTFLLLETALFSKAYHTSLVFQNWFDTLIGGKKNVIFFLGNPGSGSLKNFVLGGGTILAASMGYHLNDVIEHKKAMMREQDMQQLVMEEIKTLANLKKTDLSTLDFEELRTLKQKVNQDIQERIQSGSKTNVSIVADIDQGTLNTNVEQQTRHKGFSQRISKKG